MKNCKLKWILKHVVMLVEALGRMNLSRCLEVLFPVGLSLSLSIVMLSISKECPRHSSRPWAFQAMLLIMSTCRHFPNWVNVAIPAIVLLIMIVRCSSAESHQKILKNKIYCSQESTRHTQGSHREDLGKERGSECGHGVLPLFGLRVGCLWLRRFTLYWPI